MFSIKEKAAIITGAAQGLGRQFAISFAAKGAKVICADYNDTKAADVVKEIKAAGGVAEVFKVNVTKPEECEAMNAFCVEKFGKTDIIINCAAIFSTIEVKPVWELSKKEWDDLIDVNLTGVFNTCKAVLPTMMEQKWGRVINISSNSFFEGRGNYVHYVASKAGTIGLTRSISFDVGTYGITCNCISPGATITEIPRGTVTPAFLEASRAKRHIKRDQVPNDLVGAAIFLASDASSFITGQTIVVDGGMVFLP